MGGSFSFGMLNMDMALLTTLAFTVIVSGLLLVIEKGEQRVGAMPCQAQQQRATSP